MSMTNFLIHKDICGSINMSMETQFHPGKPHQINSEHLLKSVMFEKKEKKKLETCQLKRLNILRFSHFPTH